MEECFVAGSNDVVFAALVCGPRRMRHGIVRPDLLVGPQVLSMIALVISR
jgi:hypothetical protein